MQHGASRSSFMLHAPQMHRMILSEHALQGDECLQSI